eukprot:15446521-Alexandrium_andersonii.AAC.2
MSRPSARSGPRASPEALREGLETFAGCCRPSEVRRCPWGGGAGSLSGGGSGRDPRGSRSGVDAQGSAQAAAVLGLALARRPGSDPRRPLLRGGAGAGASARERLAGATDGSGSATAGDAASEDAGARDV